MPIPLRINGEAFTLDAAPHALLLDSLRERLGLRGTKYGCGEGECGACTVLLDGRPVNACLTTLGQAAGREVVTIEAMATDPFGAPLLEALARAGAVQCGFCTPGIVMAARALLAENPAPNTAAIQRALGGNLCRCTGYAKVLEAVRGVNRPHRAAPLFGQSPPGAMAFHRRDDVAIDAKATDSRALILDSTDYARPSTVEEALTLLARGERPWQVLAGGTDLLVRHEHHLQDLALLDIGALAALRFVREDEGAVRIGALACYADIARAPAVGQWARALAEAAVEVGGAQIQNMGTLAGNLANASPAADGVPPLLALNAEVVLRSARGERRVPAEALATGPGRTVIAPDELLTEIVIPKVEQPGQEVTFFQKVGPRKAQTIAKASVAVRGWLQAGRLTHVRVTLGAVAPTVIVASATAEALMAGPLTQAALLAAGEVAAGECRPIDDVRSTAAYRRRLVRGILVRGLWPFV